MSTAETPLRTYLLGLLPDEEATRLEERFFSEGTAFEELLLAEDDLIDDYLDERLSADERRAFEERLHVRPELQERLLARRVLTAAMRRRRDATRRSSRWRAWVVLAAAAVLVVAWLVVSRLPTAPAPNVARTGPSDAPGTTATNAPPPPSVVLLLGSAGIRGASAVPTVVLDDATPSLRLRRPLSGRGREVAISVENVDGGVVFRGQARPITDGGAAYLEVEIPAAALRRGDYLLRSPQDESFFRVQR
jgi:hypothetical protein